MPFANPGHPSHDWINHDSEIIGGMNLLNILRSRSLTFLVPKLMIAIKWGKWQVAPPLRYPYDVCVRSPA